MDGRITMYVLLVCVWCSLDTGRLLMVVTAQPTVSAVILTPEADRKEGGQVDMRCVATNLESDHIVGWRSTHPNVTLRWNDTTITTNNRFMFTTTYPQRGEVVQDLTITDLQIDDYDEYVCNVKKPLEKGGHLTVATSKVILSAPSYPICFPSEPITVDTGTELRMRCLSETDNPAVITGTHPMTDPSSYPWTSSSVDGVDTLSLTLTITVADDGVSFNCYVVQGQTVTRSCIIGPINVTISEDATDELTSIEPESTQTTSNINQPPPSNPWIVAFVVTFILLVVSIIVIILCAYQIFKMRRLIKSHTRTEDSRIPKADPYMELQPTADKNSVYMEPTTATTTTQDTYYQPVEVETGSPEDDYARPEGSTNTSYEAVRKPQSSAERPYQNINN